MVGCQPYAQPAFTARKYSRYSFLLEARSNNTIWKFQQKSPLLQPILNLLTSWPNSLSTTAEGAVVCCLQFSINCSKSHGIHSSLAKQEFFFQHEEEVCNNFRPSINFFETLGSYAEQFFFFCETFQPSLVRTRAAPVPTRVNTVTSWGILLHHREPHIYLPATNPMFQCATRRQLGLLHSSVKSVWERLNGRVIRRGLRLLQPLI